MPTYRQQTWQAQSFFPIIEQQPLLQFSTKEGGQDPQQQQKKMSLNNHQQPLTIEEGN
jgi:hypothetical protein